MWRVRSRSCLTYPFYIICYSSFSPSGNIVAYSRIHEEGREWTLRMSRFRGLELIDGHTNEALAARVRDRLFFAVFCWLISRRN